MPKGFGFRVEALRYGVSGSGDDVQVSVELGGLEPLWNIRGECTDSHERTFKRASFACVLEASAILGGLGGHNN